MVLPFLLFDWLLNCYFDILQLCQPSKNVHIFYIWFDDKIKAEPIAFYKNLKPDLAKLSKTSLYDCEFMSDFPYRFQGNLFQIAV